MSPSTSSTLGIGLIGAGRIGRVHAQNIVHRIPAARLVGVADVNQVAAEQLTALVHTGYADDDYRRLLDDPEIDAVFVCSATHTHAQAIIDAAAAGKHVFCEKPIDLTLTGIDAALHAVGVAGVKLQIGFNRRFDANFARIRRAVVDGEIGAPHLLHVISRDPSPPPTSYIKVSGGIFLDMTIHDFDMARFLMGSEVEEVYATGGILVDPAIGTAGDLDTVLVTLKFANGAFGTIDNSRRAVYGYDQRAEVFGSAGAIATGNNYSNSVILSTANSVQRDLPLNFFMERYTESYVNEVSAFVAAVVDDSSVPVTGEDGRVAVVMGYAAQRSVTENRPVRLDEIEAPG